MNSSPDPQLPIDVAVDETHTFLGEVLPPPPARVIEVGGGRGEVAERLLGDGYALKLIDPSPTSVAAARRRGIDCVEQSWIDYGATEFGRTEFGASEHYDAALFVRSFHHITPVSEAAGIAAKCLVPGGCIVIEDFAFQTAEPALIEWCATTAERLRETGEFAPEAGTLLDHLLNDSRGPAEAWQHWGDDVHGIHSEDEMLTALQQHFTMDLRRSVPYAYRYFLTGLPNDASGVATARELLDAERRAIADGAFAAIGRRWVGSARITR